MPIQITDLVPELEEKLQRFLLACAGDADLARLGQTVVLTEGRRDNLTQAGYFCMGRTPSEIAAELDHREASQEIRAVMAEAMGAMFGPNALPEDRAPGRIVTNALPCLGPHCEGRAAHFRVKQGARLLSDAETPWDLVGAIARRCGLTWGGYWTFRDCEHVEVPRPKPGKPALAAALAGLLFLSAISPAFAFDELIAWDLLRNSLVEMQLDTDGDGLPDRTEWHVVAHSGRTVLTDAELDAQAAQDSCWLFIVEEDNGRLVYFVQPQPLAVSGEPELRGTPCWSC